MQMTTSRSDYCNMQVPSQGCQHGDGFAMWDNLSCLMRPMLGGYSSPPAALPTTGLRSVAIAPKAQAVVQVNSPRASYCFPSSM